MVVKTCLFSPCEALILNTHLKQRYFQHESLSIDLFSEYKPTIVMLLLC